MDHLADLAYDISAVIGLRDTAENDNLLTLSNLKRENQIRRKRQERKLRRLAMTIEKERIDFQDKLYLAKLHKVLDTSRRDLADRKKFTSITFNGNGALTTFIDDLRTKTMARSGGERLMTIESKKINCQLLERFTSITKIEMKAEKKSHTLDAYNSSKNLYIATWRSIGSNVKREMNVHRDLIGCDGPTFLWYIFKYYHTTAVQAVMRTLAKMNSLQRVMNDKCQGNVDRFVTYVITLLLCLAENGGRDDQAFDKVYEILINSPYTVFNSEIIIYKQVNSSNLDVIKLLVKAREEYRTLVENKTWLK